MAHAAQGLAEHLWQEAGASHDAFPSLAALPHWVALARNLVDAPPLDSV